MLVVGGPNGSGKTTLALENAAETGFPYLGADAIAASLNSGDPASAERVRKGGHRYLKPTSVAGFHVPCPTSGKSIVSWPIVGC